MAELTDRDRREMALRKATKSSWLKGNHPFAKTYTHFTNSEWEEVDAVTGHDRETPVTAGWIDKKLSWVVCTRTVFFKDTVWISVSPWDVEIDYGNFKMSDETGTRKALVRKHGVIVGNLTYETGEASMVLLPTLMTIQRLRRPID